MAMVSRRRSTTHPQGRSTAEDGGGETFLARKEWASRGPPRAWSAGWQVQGKKVSPPPLRQGDRGFAVLRPDQAITRPRGSCVQQPRWEKTWQTWPAQEVGFSGRRVRNAGVQKGGRNYPGTRHSACAEDTSLSVEGIVAIRLKRSKQRSRVIRVRSADAVSLGHPNRGNDEARPQLSLVEGVTENGDLKPAPSAGAVCKDSSTVRVPFRRRQRWRGTQRQISSAWHPYRPPLGFYT